MKLNSVSNFHQFSSSSSPGRSSSPPYSALDSKELLGMPGTSSSFLNTLNSLEHMDFNENYNGFGNGDNFSMFNKNAANNLNSGSEFVMGSINSKIARNSGQVQSAQLGGGQRRSRGERSNDLLQQQHSFSGRHVMWNYFDVSQQHTGYYYCRASPDCNSAYTWPPSTTVAGRHVRDRHPEVYSKIMNEHTARKSIYEAQFSQMRAASQANNRKRPAVNFHNSNNSSSATMSPSTSSAASRSFGNSNAFYDSALSFSTNLSQQRKASSTSYSNNNFPTTEASATFEIRPTKLVKLEEIISGTKGEDVVLGLIEAPGEGNTEGKNGVETDAEINKKTCELKAVRSEMSKLRDQELTLKLKNQKTTEQLLDVQAETGNLRARNEQLEKRQKDFDGEMKLLRERLTELSEQKCRLEARCADFDASVKERNAQIQSLKNENSEQRANLVKARRELDEVLDANTSKAGDVAKEEELLTLRKAKRDLEAKLSEIEGELEETVIRNQTLEQKVIRLEMSTERLRSDLQREADGKEAEMAEMRAQYQRRMRTFEDEINELNDVNSSLQKQNRIIESRARQFDTQSQASSLDLGGSSLFYKRELRKALVLLRDTQSLLAHEREGAPNQSIVRQLKEQLEDAESAKLAALRSRHSLESEISDLRNQLDLANAAKNSADEKVLAIMRDKNSANALAQEHDEQLQDLLKKYKAQIQQSHTDSITLADQVEQIANLERAKQRLQEQLNEAAVNIEFNKLHTVEKHKVQLMQLKLRDLQSKLDLEISQKLRFESITAKLKEQIECLQEQLMEIKSARDRESELAWKIKKDYKMQQEEINDFKKRETDLLHRQKMAKLASDQLNEEHEKTLTNLRLALKRIDTLQAALNADLTAGSDIEEEDEDINDREDEEDITDGDLAASVSAAVNESIVSNNNIATIESTAKTNGKLATSSLTDDESTNGRKNELNGLGSVC